MKKFKPLLIIFLSTVVVLFLGLVIFLKTLDINRFKGKITQQISKSIDRRVTIKSISLEPSISQGVSLDISGLTIGDHTSFSSKPMFYVDSAHLNIDILPLILRRQIFVSKIEFDSPKLNLIRSSAGEVNAQKLTEQDQRQSTESDNISTQGPASIDEKIPDQKKNDITFGDMLIRSILINDGTIIFTDYLSTPAVTIPITGLDLQISNLSLDVAFPFKVNASLWSKKKNIHAAGLAQFNAQNQQVRIDDLKVETDLSNLLLSEVMADILSFRKSGLKGGLDGTIVIDVHQMVLGEGGLLVLSSEARLTQGKMQFEDFPIPIENMSIHFEISESDLEIKEIRIPLASGELNATGRIIGYSGEQKLIGDLDIQNIRLDELTAYLDLPMGIDGVMNGHFSGERQGALNASLIGKGTLEIVDGRIVDVNLLKLVLSKLAFIPNLANQIEENLPEKYREVFNRNDTLLGGVKMDTRIQNSIVMIDRLEMTADGFTVVADGQYHFDQNLKLNANFYIESDLSRSMLASSEELSFLLDKQGRIHIPFTSYSGKLENFHMVPDIGDLGASVIRNKGREELRKVIFRALDLDNIPTTENPPNPDATPQEREVSPEEEIIENILDMIPIFQ